MIKTIDVECNAANPNLPLKPMFAFVNSPSSIRVRNVPKRIGDWCIRKVYFTAVYPDSTVKTAECVLTGGVWVGTIEGTNTSGTSTNGYTIFADGTDENGNNVTGYVLGKGDIEILEADGTLSPDPARYTVKLLSAEAEQPREGDMYPTDDGYVIWQSGQANLLGTPFEQITAYVDSAISSKADLSALDDYVKIDELSSKADLSAVPTKTSQLSNDSGFITSAEIEPYHNVLTPTENTGLAKTAYILALADRVSMQPVDGGQFYTTLSPNRDLTNQFRATMGFVTYWPYVMTKYNGQTLSPELSLYFCKDELRYGTSRPRQYYDGYMFRTAGAGFAIPCSEDGTPDGRLVETTGVQTTYVLMTNNTTSIHSIGFSTAYDDPYNNIITIDGQTDSIFAHRVNQYNSYSIQEEIANKSELPTKTSDLTNDSGFITSADIPTPSYIVDANGNKIEADLDYEIHNQTATSWTLHYPLYFGQDVTLEYSGRMWMYEGTNHYPQHPQQEKVTLEYDNNTWGFYTQYYSDDLATWIDRDECTFSANERAEDITFDCGARITRTMDDSGKLATQEWVQAKISAKADLSALSTKADLSALDNYYTKSETSSAIEITNALDTKRDLNDMTVKGIPPNAQQSRFNITDGTITNNAYYYDEGRWESGQSFAVYTTLTADVYELKKYNTSEWVSVGTFSLDNNYEATITNDGTTYSIIGYAGDLVVNTQLSSYATKNWVHDGYLPLSGGMMNGAIEWKSNYYQGVKGRLGYSADQGLLELYDNTKNKTTYFSPDMFTGLSSNVVFWPPESGTFATREWVMEQLATLSVMLQGGN